MREGYATQLAPIGGVEGRRGGKSEGGEREGHMLLSSVGWNTDDEVIGAHTHLFPLLK